MDKQRKQQIINEVTSRFQHKQWFNGAGFEPNTDRLIIAYNYYPAFELVELKSALLNCGVEYELKDIRVVLPGSQKDDVPSHIRH
jgi:hypothetical protein